MGDICNELIKNTILINPSIVTWSHQAFEHEPIDAPFDELYECNGYIDWHQLDEAHWSASSNEMISNDKS